MTLETSNRSPEVSWAGSAGILLLAAASFVGCAQRNDPANSPPSPEAMRVSQPLDQLPGLAITVEMGRATAIDPRDQAFLDQTSRLEKALSTIQSNSDHDGWRGSERLRKLILNDFNLTEQAILERIKGGKDLNSERLERLYESAHTVHGLFKENGLAYNCVANLQTATDGNMSHLYGLQAQLILTRFRLAESH